MVAKWKKQVHIVDFTELAKAAHSDPRAWAEVLRYNEIIQRGGKPEVLYSRLNGYRVRDRFAPEARPV